MRTSRLATLTAAVQWIVGVAAATAVVLLFTLEGADPPSTTSAVSAAALADGAEIYARQCASCHGNIGEGGLGPALAGSVVARYPDPRDQATVVATGRLGMPGFSSSLSDDEIAAVVAFTRSGLR